MARMDDTVTIRVRLDLSELTAALGHLAEVMGSASASLKAEAARLAGRRPEASDFDLAYDAIGVLLETTGDALEHLEQISALALRDLIRGPDPDTAP